MKKLGLFAISLMSISFLASCNNPGVPTYTVSIEHDEHCQVSTDTLTGVAGSTQSFTINPFEGFNLADDGLIFVDEHDEEITYDGNANYDYDTKKVTVKIGSSDAILKCTTIEAYKVTIINDDHCTVSKDYLVGAVGSTQTFTLTPDEGYVISESGLCFMNDQGESVSYDGNYSYNNSTNTVTIEIGNSNINLKCFASKIYHIGFEFLNCRPTEDISSFDGPADSFYTFSIGNITGGYVLNNDLSFTWVNSRGEPITYDGGFWMNSDMIMIRVGNGDATLRCTAIKLQTIKIKTSNCTASVDKIVDVNGANVTFEINPDVKNGYTLTSGGFTWVDDDDKEVADYGGGYFYDDEKGTVTVHLSDGDITLKCVAKLKTSTVDIKAFGNCSTTQTSLEGKMGDTKTFDLNIVEGNAVNFEFAPSNTGATASIDANGKVTVKIGNDNVTLSCSTSPQSYTWNFVDEDDIVIPSTWSISGIPNDKVEISYTLSYGYDFVGPSVGPKLTFNPNNTKTTYEFISDNIIVFTFGIGGGDITFNVSQRWYRYNDWWKWCSSGDKIPQRLATEDDIGRKVKATLKDGRTYEIRLIDIDHDYLTSDNTKYAHCTFEFVNVITSDDGHPYFVHWSDGYDCWNFFDSTLNIFLKPGGDIYNLFPDEKGSLINEMTSVTKYVAICKNEGVFEKVTWRNQKYNTIFFPLSFHEIINKSSDPNVQDNEGYIYAYYKNATDEERAKKTAATPSSTFYYSAYWLRSPAIDYHIIDQEGKTYYNYCAWNIGVYGPMYKNRISKGFGVAPAFCI